METGVHGDGKEDGARAKWLLTEDTTLPWTPSLAFPLGLARQIGWRNVPTFVSRGAARAPPTAEAEAELIANKDLIGLAWEEAGDFQAEGPGELSVT